MALIDLTGDDPILDLSEGATENNSSTATANEEKSSSNDELNNIKSKLKNFLANGKVGSEISSFEAFLDPINPGLNVDGVGPVGLPLSAYDAQRLITSVQSELQNGTGTTTSPISAIWDIWEIPADRFKLRNPAWQKFLKKVVAKTSIHMGLAGQPGIMDVRLVKMAIQTVSNSEALSQISTNTDDPLQIGTLAICLPSFHSGGDIFFSGREQKQQCQTSQTSEFDCSIFSWFSDVDMMFEPLTVGCRLILVYSIVQTRRNPISASMVQIWRHRFSEALETWKKVKESSPDKTPGILTWVLESDGHKKSLSLAELKDLDRRMVNSLKVLCLQKGVQIYVANATKEVEGTPCNSRYEYDSRFGQYADEELEMEDETETSYSLKKVVDLDGTVLSRHVVIPSNSIIQDVEDCPFGEDPHEKENDGDFVHHHFNGVAVLMVLPRDHAALILDEGNRAGTDIKGILERAIIACSNPDANPITKDELLYMCQYIIKECRDPSKNVYGHFSNEILNLAVRGSILLGEPDLDFDISDLLEYTYRDIGAAIASRGFETFRETISLGISRINKLNTRCAVLDRIKLAVARPSNTSDMATLPSVQDWIRFQVECALNSCHPDDLADASRLVQLSSIYGTQFLVTSVLDAVKRSIDSQRFVFDFLGMMFETSQTENALKGAALSCFRDVLSNLIPGLTIRPKIDNHKKQKMVPALPTFHTYNPGWYDQTPKDTATQVTFPFQDVANTIDQCLSASLHEDLEVLVNHLIQEVGLLISAVTEESTKTLISILDRSIVLLLDSLNVMYTIRDPSKFKRLLQPNVQRLFTQALESYIMLHLCPVPEIGPAPTDWSMQPKGCGCAECIKMDSFLTNPHQVTSAVFQRYNQHLKKQLKQRGSGNEEEFILQDLAYLTPSGFKITKTHNVWETKHKEWRKSCENAAAKARRLWKIPIKKGQVSLPDLLEQKISKKLDETSLIL